MFTHHPLTKQTLTNSLACALGYSMVFPQQRSVARTNIPKLCSSRCSIGIIGALPLPFLAPDPLWQGEHEQQRKPRVNSSFETMQANGP